MQQQRAKIFGIGLSKTGTTSLTTALSTLGYSTIHFPSMMDEVDRHDAATDTTVASNFESLDARYPGSRFIYTTRERESWLRSCEKFWSMMQPRFDNSILMTELHKQLYGTTIFDRVCFAEAYDRHDRRVREYFAAAPGRLLTLDIIAETDPWLPLCRFLGAGHPGQPFPHDHDSVAIERLLIRYLAETNEIERLARATRLPRGYLEGLRRTRPSHPEPVVHPGSSRLAARVVAFTHDELGSIRGAARVLGIEPGHVAAALHRSRGRRRSFMQRLRRSLARRP